MAANSINGGVDSYSDIITVIEKNSSKALGVYPNPAVNGIINITNAGTSTIAIVNVTGQKVLSVKGNGTFTKVDVSRLASGIYFIVTEGKSVKFIKP